MNKLKVGVIFGGMSTEHDVSISSGTSIIKNLSKEKYEILPIYISEDGSWYKYTKNIEEIEALHVGDKITELEKIENEFEYLKSLDVAFPVLHGLYGEDGTIQGLLELLKVKYVGCKVLGSSICMDKVYAKIIFEKAQIPQANYVYVKADKDQYIYVNENFEEKELDLKNIAEITEQKLGFPVFVKPSNSGSSVGIKKANNIEELEDAIKYASNYDTKILIEEEIIGREIECAVLGNTDVKATCVGEILPSEDFYTFDAKYNNAQSRVVIPAEVEQQKQDEIKELAIKAFKAVDGKGLSRVDFFIRKSDNKVYINEINTLPGFTQISMYPKLWEQCGIEYSKLLDELNGDIELIPDSTPYSFGEVDSNKFTSLYDAYQILSFNQSMPISDDTLTDYRTKVFENYSREILDNAEILLKYRGYIVREKQLADKISHLESLIIPDGYDYDKISGLSIECRQKLKRYLPRTIGQASRISGVSPSDISILLIHFGR